MSIYPEKRKGQLTGRLRVEVQRNKRTLVKFATSRKEATRLETEMKAGLHDNPEPVSVVTTDTSKGLKLLEDQVDKLWKGMRSEHSTKLLANRLLANLAKVLKEKGVPDDLSLIRAPHINEAIERTNVKGLSERTWNRSMSCISKLLAWALEEEIIETMPRLKYKKPIAKAKFILSEEAESRMKAILKEKGWEDIITLMDVQLATGCRINEVRKRTPEDLSDDGDGFYSLYLGLTKNGQERYAVLDTALAERYGALLASGRMPSYNSVRDRLASARKLAKLPTTQPTHAHRHTVATRLSREANINVTQLKDFMGHESIQTTLNYIHADVREKKRVAKGLMRRPTAPLNLGDTG